MKVAVIGSRTLEVKNLEEYLPRDTTEIVSGGALGIDSCAREYALSHNLIYTEFLPLYEKYGKAAPIVRNKEIVEYADMVIAFWNGESKGSQNVIDLCQKIQKKIIVYRYD